MKKAIFILALMLVSAPSWAYSPMTLNAFGGRSPEYGGYWLVYQDCGVPVHGVFYGSCGATPHESGGCVYYTIDLHYTIDESFNYLPRFIMGDWVSNAAFKAAVDYALNKQWITEYNVQSNQGLIDARAWDMNGLLYMYYGNVIIDGQSRRYGVIRLHKQDNTFDGACYHGEEYWAFFYWWADGQPPVAPNAWIANLPEPGIHNEYTRKYGNSFNIYGLFLNFIKGLSNSSLFVDLPAFKKDDLGALGEGNSIIHVNLGNLGGQLTIDLAQWSTLYLIIRSIFLTCCMYYAVRLFLNGVEE